MNRHMMLLSGILAAALTLTFVPRVAADPPPWAGVWSHNKHFRERDDFRGGHFAARGYDRSNPIYDRINYDRGLIAQWQNTGRHQKVVRWAREDIVKAQRELSEYRSQRRFNTASYGYDPYSQQPPPSYDPYYPAQRQYDPYSDGGFEWKRDWPLLLGTVINGQTGR
jgi:hypothetical protein